MSPPTLVPPRRFMAFRVVFRYVSGRALDGRARTDSSFLHPASKVLTPTGRATRWARLPGWKRAAWRILGPITTAGVLIAYLMFPTATTVTGTTVTTAGTWLGGRRAVRAIKQRKVNKRYVNPLAAVLAKPLGQEANDPARWVYVPPELTSDVNGSFLDRFALPGWWPHLPSRLYRKSLRKPAEGRINLPVNVLPTKEVQVAVSTGLAMKVHDDLMIEWFGKGHEPYVTFKARPQPPKHVTFDDIAELVAQAPASAPILGLAAFKPMAIDIDTDAPHAGVSCGSGAGKSVLLRGMIAQWLHNGIQVVILDGKQTSQRWCKDLPGVRYCRTGEQMHNALIEVQGEVLRRGEIVDTYDAEVDAADIDVGPRIVVVFEEMNIGVAMLIEYWDEIKPRGAKRSPALRAWDHILAAGREFKCHAVAVAQMMTVQATGGNPAARENMGPRILARATRKAWEMLAPECGPPYPRMTKRRGRMYLAFEGEPTEFQAALWSVRQARQWATSGTVTVPATWTTPSDQRDSTGAVTPLRFYSLAEAAREDWCTPSYDALRQHLSRARKAGTAPAGHMISGTTKYTREDLTALIAKRATESELTS